MKVYDELVARGLIAQVTNEDEIRNMIDQGNFPFGVGICALRRNKVVGLYMNRIHTSRDTILEETNVNILRAALTTLISSDAAK